jgi:DNA-binding NarL/FixJ family response regulator
MTERKQRVFLVDDHPLVREGLSMLIGHEDDLEVCGEAGDPREALRAIAKVAPDIAVVDLSLGEYSGMDLIRSLRAQYQDLSVVVLSMHDEKLYAERVIRAGARGYVMKREMSGTILSAIRHVLSGKLYVSSEVAEMFAEKFVDRKLTADASPIEQLSDRELEVFSLLGQGHETRRIAENLHLSVKTVQAYCARIKEKLNLANGTELLREAVYWHENRASGGASAPRRSTNGGG